MNLEEKLKANSWRYSTEDKEVIYFDDALSICQEAVDEAKIKELENIPNLLKFCTEDDCDNCMEYKGIIDIRIKELKEKL